MRRLRVYVDTSVIGGCLDEEFVGASRALLDMAGAGELTLLVSNVVSDELLEAPEAVQEVFSALPDACLEWLDIGPEEEDLRQKYLDDAVVTDKSKDDALHVAAATVARADMIVSWNFRHIVNFRKMRGYNAVNLREGYPTLEIHSPREVVSYEEEQGL